MPSTRLKPDSLLQCARALTVTLNSGSPATISVDGRTLDCGANALAVLDAFARPTTLAAATAALRARSVGGRDWMEMTSAILRFHAEGVLVPADTAGVAGSTSGFARPGIHARMLSDEERTGAYLAAIRDQIRPGDTVVEIGTGTGVLSVAAAKAGAARVYAIEATAIASVAEVLIRSNHVADRVQLIRGWSAQVELPERADVLISEIIGNDPLGENVLEVTADARRRFLKSDARLIPRALRVFALPVELPPDELARRTFQPDATTHWSERYGLDFSSLASIEFDRPGVFYVRPHVPRDWRQPSPAALLSEIDLTAESNAIVQASGTTVATTAATVSGVAVFFELDLAPGVVISTAPATVSENSSWQSPVWVASQPVAVEPGQSLVIRLDRAAGDSWVSVSRGQAS